jgi:hypothetical protein
LNETSTTETKLSLLRRGWQYLNVFPSEKALKREREKLHEMTDHRQCYKPIPELVEELNLQLKGWANYFSFRYPREAFREINTYVRYRLEQYLKRPSQRPSRMREIRTSGSTRGEGGAPQGVTFSPTLPGNGFELSRGQPQFNHSP